MSRTRDQIRADIFQHYAQLGACVTGLSVSDGNPGAMTQGLAVYAITYEKMNAALEEFFDLVEPELRKFADEQDAKARANGPVN